MRVLIHMGDPYLIDNPCTKRIRALKEALKLQGHRVVIMAPDIKGNARDPEVTYCPAIPLRKKNVFYRLANGISFAISSICSLRKAGRIDIVLTTTPPALISPAGWLMAKIKHARLVYDVRDIWPDVALEMNEFTEDSIYYKIFRFIRDFMLRHADLITAVSDGKVNKLKEYAPQKRIVKIPNGFDVYFLQNKLNTALYKKIAMNGNFVCVYTGNLGLAQGLRQLLYIADKAKKSGLHAVFWLYGKGAEEQELREHVREHRLDNVFFGGKLSNRDIFTVLKAADISFVPLVNENLKDSIPTKIYEALGVGCPVLLAAEGDAVSVLEDAGLGIAVRPNQMEALWNAFLRLYNDKESMEHQKKHAMELMQNQYSIQRSAQVLVKELKKCVRSK
ncbi:MAG: glycosyltransferase family 4 protein [Lachnospiraceae bacterium]|nr:glycosyltransferase family 4 protein [Lachnospiraceae bacterium]